MLTADQCAVMVPSETSRILCPAVTEAGVCVHVHDLLTSVGDGDASPQDLMSEPRYWHGIPQTERRGIARLGARKGWMVRYRRSVSGRPCNDRTMITSCSSQERRCVRTHGQVRWSAYGSPACNGSTSGFVDLTMHPTGQGQTTTSVAGGPEKHIMQWRTHSGQDKFHRLCDQ
eukprot:2997558-Amphidinium_carterae.2